MPYSLAEIRAFSRMGHTVHAADTFEWAPGNKSNHATEYHETVSPREDPVGYLAQINMLVDIYRIDLVVPTFEEVMYLSQFGRTAGQHGAEIFTSSFDTLNRLHDKAKFSELVSKLGLPVAPARTCTSREQFQQAIAEHERYFARAVSSRAGSGVCTNTGPLAETSDPDEVEPTPQQPWIVQPFLEGEEICSFSVVRNGKIAAHSTYCHPKVLDGCGGIIFESIEDPRTLEAAQRIAEAVGYHGQLSFDFMKCEDGKLYMIECNPRPTAGVTVMPHELFVNAVLGELDGSPPHVVASGTRRAIRSALLRDIVFHPSEWRSDLKELFSDADSIYYDPDDPLPGLYQFLSLSHVLKHRRDNPQHANDKLSVGFLHDICWDGTILDLSSPGMDDLPTLRVEQHFDAAG